jgi:predicted RNA binding protein YcfA (HicA-like mRNA interferase family)
VKPRELVRHLEAGGCQLLREGASHSIYTNPATGIREAIPRHQGNQEAPRPKYLPSVGRRGA